MEETPAHEKDKETDPGCHPESAVQVDRPVLEDMLDRVDDMADRVQVVHEIQQHLPGGINRGQDRCGVNCRREEHTELKEQFQHAADVVHHRVDRGEEKAQPDGKEDDRDKEHGNKQDLPSDRVHKDDKARNHGPDADGRVNNRANRGADGQDLAEPAPGGQRLGLPLADNGMDTEKVMEIFKLWNEALDV